MKLTATRYYVLNFTWGIIMTTVGMLASIVLMICGYVPKQYKLTWYFVVPGNWGGVELGMCYIVCAETPHILNHEFGHTIQNAMYGPGMVLISLCSAARYWIREIQSSMGKTLEPYDAIWFEGEATKIGTEMFN